jgi:hypothetical protein
MTKPRRRSDLPWCHNCLWFAPFLNEVGSGKFYGHGPMVAADPEQPDWPIVMSGDTCPKHEAAKQEDDDGRL